MIIVKIDGIVGIDPKTGAPRLYKQGEEFPRKVESLLKLGHLEEIEDKKAKSKKEEIE